MKSTPEMFKRPCILLAVGLAAGFIVYGLIKDWFLLAIQTGFDAAVTLLFLPQVIVAGSFARLVSFSQFPISVSAPMKLVVIAVLAFFASLPHAWIIISIWNKFHKKKIVISTAPIFTAIVLAFITAAFLMMSFLLKAREHAGMSICNQNLRALINMCHMYALDNDNHFPPGLEALNMAGYEIGNLTSCPAAKGKADYGFNTAATVDCVSDDSPTPLLGDFDSDNHGRGGWVGYAGGHILWHSGGYSAGSGLLEGVSPEDWVRQ